MAALQGRLCEQAMGKEARVPMHKKPEGWHKASGTLSPSRDFLLSRPSITVEFPRGVQGMPRRRCARAERSLALPRPQSIYSHNSIFPLFTLAFLPFYLQFLFSLFPGITRDWEYGRGRRHICKHWCPALAIPFVAPPTRSWQKRA